MELRKRPLLVLYYAPHEGQGEMIENDVEDIYREFRERGWSRDRKHPNLDVLIHTLGGNPDAAYRIAQILRDFSFNVIFLVPEFAYSAGTLVCLCGNEIRMGAYATLGPIDITVGDIELASIEHFKRFAIDCCKEVLEMLHHHGAEGETDVESNLLVEMTKQVRATQIGLFYRETDLTRQYARRLMLDYMFAASQNKQHLSDSISAELLHGFASHDFALDYHMCKRLRMLVSEMREEESERTKKVVEILNELVVNGEICPNVDRPKGRNYKAPFIRLYDIPTRAGRRKA
jgi:hypothetical protein